MKEPEAGPSNDGRLSIPDIVGKKTHISVPFWGKVSSF